MKRLKARKPFTFLQKDINTQSECVMSLPLSICPPLTLKPPQTNCNSHCLCACVRSRRRKHKMATKVKWHTGAHPEERHLLYHLPLNVCLPKPADFLLPYYFLIIYVGPILYKNMIFLQIKPEYSSDAKNLTPQMSWYFLMINNNTLLTYLLISMTLADVIKPHGSITASDVWWAVPVSTADKIVFVWNWQRHARHPAGHHNTN